MKKIYNIKVANKDESGVELAIKSLEVKDIQCYYGPFKTKITFLCTDEQWKNFETIIRESNIKIKRV